MKEIIIPLIAIAQAAAPAIGSEYENLNAYDNTKICYGMGNDTDSQNRPLGAIDAQRKYGDMGALFIGSENARSMQLTFDEGYENGYTSQILDTLKEKNVSAVFFVTYDYAKHNPELIRRMIDEGHTVGNHTFSHPSLPECSADEMYNELSQLHNYIKDEFGYEMYVMRPPMGEFSERVLKCAKGMGYTTVLWSFAYPRLGRGQSAAARGSSQKADISRSQRRCISASRGKRNKHRNTKRSY